MLLKLGGPFKMKKIRSEEDENSRNLKAVGLGILVHRSLQPNLVVKQSIRLTFSSLSTNSNNTNNASNPCSLKSCSLCKKYLNPQEDIYMYRGDQGYCSIKCRNKQIESDEKAELEASTRKILASFRKCRKNECTQTQTHRITHTRRIPPLVS